MTTSQEFLARSVLQETLLKEKRAPKTEEEYKALSALEERLEQDIAEGHNTPEGDAKLALIDTLFEASPLTFSPDDGVVEKSAAGVSRPKA